MPRVTRRYGATAVASLIKIRTLGERMARPAVADRSDARSLGAPAFAEAVRRIDSHLRDEIERLEASRKQIGAARGRGQPALPPEVTSDLEPGFGRSGRQSGWWRVSGTGGSWSRLAGPIEHPRGYRRKARAARSTRNCVRLYRVLSDSSKATQSTTRVSRRPPTSWPAWPSRQYAAGELNPVGGLPPVHLAFDLLDALAAGVRPADAADDRPDARARLATAGTGRSGWRSRPG